MNSLYVKSYTTPQDFLDETLILLQEKELDNNLIIGLCNGFEDKTKVQEGCVFINTICNEKIVASSIKTLSRAIVCSYTKDEQYIKPLADFYLQHGISVSGVFGDEFSSSAFLNYYGKKQKNAKTLIVHQLSRINDLPLSSGKLVLADEGDLDLLTDWTMNFEADVQSFFLQSRETAYKNTLAKIKAGSIFKWVDNNEVLGICAIMRKTEKSAIVGLVYTPPILRGKGYATSCVIKLSEKILNEGSKYCGLFTDKANPTSNSIYRKIGYVPSTEFKDIEFE